MSRRARRRSRERQDRIGGALLFTAGAILLMGLAGAWVWVSRNTVRYDAVTYCPLSGPSTIHAIVVDQSDKVSELQGKEIENYLLAAVSKAEFGERIDLYSANGEAGKLLQPVLQLCSPGTGKDANEIYQNPVKIRRRFEEQFRKVLATKIGELLNAESRSSSPIIESIKAATVASFSNPTGQDDPVFRLTIVSDMIQNSPVLSQYRSDRPYEQVSVDPGYLSVRPNFRGASIEIIYVQRPTAVRKDKKPIQNRGHQLFWEKLITASGGTLGTNTFTPI
jgi:hypothetical protein